MYRQFGSQPVLILEVDWVGGTTLKYSDVEIPDHRRTLISVDGLSGTTQLIGTGSSTNVSVVVDSTDDEINAIFRTIDIHLRPARVYLSFVDDLADRTLLFDGLVNSNISWSEGDRSLKFELITKIEGSLVGFSMEDGLFPRLTGGDGDRPWPLPFGTVCHYPAQRVSNPVKGFLLQGQGVADPTLATRICQLERAQCPQVPDQTKPPLAINPQTGVPIFPTQTDEECLHRKRNELCILRDLRQKQLAEVNPVLLVNNGEAFPQNKLIKIRAGSVTYTGTMNGNVFTIKTTRHPDDDKVAPCRQVKETGIGFRNLVGPDDVNNCNTNFNSLGPGQECTPYRLGVGAGVISGCIGLQTGTNRQQVYTGGVSASWQYYDEMQAGRFIFLPAGTEVALAEFDDDLVFIASLVPGVVTQVHGYRRFGDKVFLTSLPTEWYTVVNVDYGGYQAVEIRLNTLPSVYNEAEYGNGWEDTVIVSFQSSVGPNPVDVIQWIVENYTPFSVDLTNFAAVKPLLAQYPFNGVLLDRRDAQQLILDIARQARLGVKISQGVIRLVYLPLEPSPTVIISESEIVLNSLEIDYSKTEELVTDYQVKWRESRSDQIKDISEEKTIRLRYNIPRYGTFSKEEDYWGINSFEQARKVATFWLIRESHTWYVVKFRTTIKHLGLEIFDSVNLVTSKFPSVKAVITGKSYDPNENLVSFEAWTPVVAGTNEPHPWAWPSTVTNNIWPLVDDGSNVGDGSGKIVRPPVGHPLYAEQVEFVESSPGDPNPSDVGYVAPPLSCKEPISETIIFSETPVIDALARQNFQRRMAEQVSVQFQTDPPRREQPPAGPPGNPQPTQAGDPPPPEQEEPRCRYLLRLWFIEAALVGKPGTCGGPCGSTPGRGPSVACSGKLFAVETYYNSYQAAAAARAEHIAAGNDLRCQFRVGDIGPINSAQLVSFTPSATYNTVRPPISVCPDAHEDDFIDGQEFDSLWPGDAPLWARDSVDVNMPQIWSPE